MVDTAKIDWLAAQLQATLDKIPAYTWYANRSGGLTFVNARCADYLGLPRDHPLGIPRQTLEWKIRALNIDKLAFR